MSGHVRWNRLQYTHSVHGQILYVQGYILALEDVLKDVLELVDAEYNSTVIDVGRVEVLEKVSQSVIKSLTEARKTLETLNP